MPHFDAAATDLDGAAMDAHIHDVYLISAP
jgi:hypothetical protein